MKKASGIDEAILSLPKGSGGLEGIENTFQVSKQKGTLHFSIPIIVPKGRGNLTPEVAIEYSTSHKNSALGLGWELKTPYIAHDTRYGIPYYNESSPQYYTWSLADRLIWIESKIVENNSVAETHHYYKPQPDGLYAQIKHIISASENYWEIRLKNGIKHIYGSEICATVFDNENPHHIFQWNLSYIEDLFNNRIIYEYLRDMGENISHNRYEYHHQYNQTYLSKIKYVNYDDNKKYLYQLIFDYSDLDSQVIDLNSIQKIQNWYYRPDPFSFYKAGFEVRTARRCQQIILAIQTLDDQELIPIKTYRLRYNETQESTNKLSLLKSVELAGYKIGEPHEDEALAPLEFSYSTLSLHSARFETIQFQHNSAPAFMMNHPEVGLIDLFGKGLPDLIQARENAYYYWQNEGNLTFAMTKQMTQHPPVSLAYPGVMFGDMRGNGSADLIVTHNTWNGYFETRFDATWEHWHAFPESLTLSLKDPMVTLVDLTGNGMVDALVTTPQAFLVYLNKDGITWSDSIIIERIHDLALFPDISFNDYQHRVRLADMTGNGMQDIVLLHTSSIEYWPNLGFGRFGKRICMQFSPELPNDIDLRRLHLVDIDGDGCDDLIYIDTNSLRIWLNQQGNDFSTPFDIHGTPMLFTDAIRFADIKGQGAKGILYSFNHNVFTKNNYYYLDFISGKKPYLLTDINNNKGAYTKIDYQASTYFYQQDKKEGLIWKTHLPFPVQCVHRVTSFDVLANSKHVSEFKYHHGYWDGIEREFRGFGRVDQHDTQHFADYNLPINNLDFRGIEKEHYSSPVELRQWFHLGAISRNVDEPPVVIDYNDEFWLDDSNRMRELSNIDNFIKAQTYLSQRKALNALKGNLLRTEVYAKDNTLYENRPYTVTELIYNLTQQQSFSAHLRGQRITHWERGTEPLTRYQLFDDYDDYGQARREVAIAVPKDHDEWQGSNANSNFLITYNAIEYAKPIDVTKYIVDRIAIKTIYEILNQKKSIREIIEGINNNAAEKRTLSHVVNHYDGAEFEGLPVGKIGEYGVLVCTKSLAITQQQIKEFLKPIPDSLIEALPPYFDSSPAWNEYPDSFKQQTPKNLGYQYYTDSQDYKEGYYILNKQYKYDFHDISMVKKSGLVISEKDALGHITNFEYDKYYLLPIRVIWVNGLFEEIKYSYATCQISEYIDVNKNATIHQFTPLGLLSSVSFIGKNGEKKDGGDTREKPSIIFRYDHHNFKQNTLPIFVHTIKRKLHYWDVINQENTRRQSNGAHELNDAEIADLFPEFLDEELQRYPHRFIQSKEYYDGHDRVLQVRECMDSNAYRDKPHGDGNLPLDQAYVPNFQLPQVIQGEITVKVSQWKIYNNKGQVLHSFAPFFATGLTYAFPNEDTYSQLSKTTNYYDGINRLEKIKYADGSLQQTIYGRVGDVSNPEGHAIPTPWHYIIYDRNDNAEKTHPDNAQISPHQLNTPTEYELDALGRIIKKIDYLQKPQQNANTMREEYVKKYDYDISGNLLRVFDPKDREIQHNFYDAFNRLWRVESKDAGITLTILNVLGQPIESRNSKYACILSSFDSLNRPVNQWARNNENESITLRLKWVYGDRVNDSSVGANLKGALYQLYDESGQITFKQYDFKGNLIKQQLRLLSDESIQISFRVDWESTSSNNLLEQQGYEITIHYDAFNYIVNTSLLIEGINRNQTVDFDYDHIVGKVKQVKVNNQSIIENRVFNAIGQPVLSEQANGLKALFAYDDKMFRLKRAYTAKFNGTLSDPAIQDTAYTFDLIGNILSQTENTVKSGIPNSQHGLNKLQRHFIYDSLSRLNSASGRENIQPINEPVWTRFKRGSELQHVQPYTLIYDYDKADNLTLRVSQSLPSNQYSFFFKEENNQLEKINNDINYQYDKVGNLIKEGDKRQFYWDYANRLYHFEDSTQAADYTYGISGRRVKKIVRRDQQTEVTVYLNATFEYHYKISNNNMTDKNNFIHIFNEEKRIATQTTYEDGNSATSYYLTDYVGNIIGITNNAGDLTSQIEYYPYGEISLGGTDQCFYGYAGKERDYETGLIYYGAPLLQQQHYVRFYFILYLPIKKQLQHKLNNQIILFFQLLLQIFQQIIWIQNPAIS